MFEAKRFDDGNLTVLEISNRAETTARFVPERGGILAELELAGKKVFYMDRNTLYDFSTNIRGGNPVLFPVCGPLEKGEYELAGHVYQMKQHGLARNMVWTEKKVDCFEDKATVVLKLTSDAGTMLNYPFKFEMELTYEIFKDKVIIKQKYINGSLHDMPFYAGFHPYFYAPGLDIKNLFIPASSYTDVKTAQTYSGQVVADFNTTSETNYVFSGLSAQEAWFERTDRCKIKVSFDENFPYLVLWALKGRDFLCLEPWMGNNYDLNRGRARILKPGKVLEAEICYSVEMLS